MTSLLAVMTAAGPVILLAGLAPVLPLGREGPVTIEDRISSFGVESLTRPAEAEAPASFYERMLAPPVDRLRAFAAPRTPDAMLDDLETRLQLAGRPYGVGAVDFIVLRAALGVVGVTVGLLAGWAAGNLGLALLLGFLVGGSGWSLPGIWIGREVTARRREIQDALPPVLDMLVVAMDAGLSFDLALGRVVEKLHNPLTAELDQVQREISLGRARAEALESLAQRAQVDDVRRLDNALQQADQLGVPIARALRTQAGEARILTHQRIQEQAAQAPVKMVIPMIVFVLPTVWLILLGPALVGVLLHGL